MSKRFVRWLLNGVRNKCGLCGYRKEFLTYSNWKIGCDDDRPTFRCSGENESGLRVSKEQNMAVYGMYDNL